MIIRGYTNSGYAFEYHLLCDYVVCFSLFPAPNMSPPPLLVPSVPTDTYSLSFTVSDLLQSNSFTLTPVDDNVPNEPNEVTQLVFFSVSDGRVEQGPTAELVIVDNDDLGKLQTRSHIILSHHV